MEFCNIESGFMGETCKDCGSDNFGGPGFCKSQKEREETLVRVAVERDRDQRKRLMDAAPDLLAACEEFVRKVEAGEAKSKRSYKQMKDALDKYERPEIYRLKHGRG